MFTAKKYCFAKTVEEAQEMLDENRNNAILGGTCWMKMSHSKYAKVIDLSLLGLDMIEEDENRFKIGAMVTLRQLEKHVGLDKYFDGQLAKMLSPIVGTQFRSCATVGGSVFSRFGFSSVNNLLAAMTCTVCFADQSEMDIYDFLVSSRERKLITHLIIKKDRTSVRMESFRNSATDLPVLSVVVGRRENKHCVFVAGRPMGPKICVDASAALDQSDIKTAKEAVAAMDFGTNMRGSKEYRTAISAVLLERCVKGWDK